MRSLGTLDRPNQNIIYKFNFLNRDKVFQNLLEIIECQDTLKDIFHPIIPDFSVAFPQLKHDVVSFINSRNDVDFVERILSFYSNTPGMFARFHKMIPISDIFEMVFENDTNSRPLSGRGVIKCAHNNAIYFLSNSITKGTNVEDSKSIQSAICVNFLFTTKTSVNYESIESRIDEAPSADHRVIKIGSISDTNKETFLLDLMTFNTSSENANRNISHSQKRRGGTPNQANFSTSVTKRTSNITFKECSVLVDDKWIKFNDIHSLISFLGVFDTKKT
jgi:hypothetical protein